MNLENLWNQAQPPFSFRYDGADSSQFLASWARAEELPGEGKPSLETWRWSDAQGLEVRARVRRFEPCGAVEWVLEFFNGGRSDSAILEGILPLDVSWPVGAQNKVVLHHANGSLCQMDDFLPLASEVHRGEIALAPIGGRSSDGALPFFNLQVLAGAADCDAGGVVLAIGWTGQWKAAWAREESSLRATAGMERTHLRLQPGETIRTPRILLIPWQGDDAEIGQNLLRRLLLDEYCPRVGGELWVPPVAHMTMSDFHHSGVVTEAGELKALHRAADLGVEAFWVDACWYGGGRAWHEEVGNWQVNTQFFPRGLKPIGDAAHERGMKFVLWFEPERVHRGTPLWNERPEWLLHSPKPSGGAFIDDNALFNLGLPQARAHMTEMISGVIQEAGVDIYRQDFNFRPLEFWAAADAPDRVGMAEIRHIEGLYAMWDELLRRHPGLCIDNCASGGRRLDLETGSRSVPLWRSDFSDVGGPSFGAGLQVGDQMQTAGLSRWMPLHTAAVWSFSPYAFRSAMSSGVVFYCNIQRDDFPAQAARAAIAELKRLRPFFSGDFYNLSPLTVGYHDWCSYQYHRPDLGEGFAMFLRRHQSPFTTMQTALRGIDAQAHYEVSFAPDFEEAPHQILPGADLLRLMVSVPQAPGSLLMHYRRVEAVEAGA
ncbi:MAG TPA: glycoside hydrolase family 36 protein [Chloroflexota bacterium]|nr:glycoside hydrolase family 36 protein [Chloroflexota bacterium]